MWVAEVPGDVDGGPGQEGGGGGLARQPARPRGPDAVQEVEGGGAGGGPGQGDVGAGRAGPAQ